VCVCVCVCVCVFMCFVYNMCIKSISIVCGIHVIHVGFMCHSVCVCVCVCVLVYGVCVYDRLHTVLWYMF